MITRPLQHDESPAVGDCFQLLPHAAYGTAIVTKVHPDLSIDCLRVYAQITGAAPSPALGFETLTNLSRESYRACKWYVTGSSGIIDNRWYEEQGRRAQEVENGQRCLWRIPYAYTKDGVIMPGIYDVEATTPEEAKALALAEHPGVRLRSYWRRFNSVFEATRLANARATYTVTFNVKDVDIEGSVVEGLVVVEADSRADAEASARNAYAHRLDIISVEPKWDTVYSVTYIDRDGDRHTVKVATPFVAETAECVRALFDDARVTLIARDYK